MYQFQATEYRFFRHDPWQSCDYKVALHLSSRSEERFDYGERLELWAEMEALNEPQGFYQTYLKNEAYDFSANLAQVVSRGRSTSWRAVLAGLLAWRNDFLQHLTKNLESDRERSLLAAIFLAEKGGLSKEDKNAYLRSGSLHLFAVSGLHVGFCSLIILALMRLCQVPYRWTFRCLPFLLLIYVFLSSFGTASVRAWLMISLWALAKSRYWGQSPLNTVTASAIVLLLYEPYFLFQLGFQYSFLIVYALLALAPEFKRVNELLSERRSFTLKNSWYQNLRLRLWRTFVLSFCVSFAAWLVSLPMTLLYNGIFHPFAVLLNALASLWVALIFMVIFLSLLFPLGSLLSSMLATLDAGVRLPVIQEELWSLKELGPFACFLFTLLIMTTVLVKVRWAYFVALAFLMSLFLYLQFRPPKHELLLQQAQASQIPQFIMQNREEFIQVNSTLHSKLPLQLEQRRRVLILSAVRKDFRRAMKDDFDKIYSPKKLTSSIPVEHYSLKESIEGAEGFSIQSIGDEFVWEKSLDRRQTLVLRFRNGAINESRAWKLSLWDGAELQWQKEGELFYESEVKKQTWEFSSFLSVPR